jgi:hypothetical protein
LLARAIPVSREPISANLNSTALTVRPILDAEALAWITT